MTENAEKLDALFVNLILIFKNAAIQQMGKIINPLTGKVEKNLEQARFSIDMIEMLKDKTRGNVSAEIEKLVDCRTELCGIRVTEEGLVCADTDGNEILFDADTIICSVGQKPLRSTVDRLLGCAPEAIEVGDCVKPGHVTEAVFRGYWAGIDID